MRNKTEEKINQENQNSINSNRRKLLSLAGAASAGALLSPLLSKAAPSTVIEAGSNVDTASYIIFQDSGKIYAKNGTTGKIDFQGSDASMVIQNAINALPDQTIHDPVGGCYIFIKSGVYNVEDIKIDKPMIIQGEGKNTRLKGLGTPGKYILNIGSGINPNTGKLWNGSSPLWWVRISDMEIGGTYVGFGGPTSISQYGGILANFTEQLILDNLLIPYITDLGISIGYDATNPDGTVNHVWSSHTKIKNMWITGSSSNFIGIKLETPWIAEIDNVMVAGSVGTYGPGTGFYIHNGRDVNIHHCETGYLDKHYHIVSSNIHAENIWWEGGNYGVYMENGTGGRIYNYSPLANKGPANLAYYDSNTKNKIVFLQPGQELDPSTQNIFNGITTSGWSAGAVCWSQSATDQYYKKVSVFINFYKNETGTPQKIIFTTPFTDQPSITRNDFGNIFTVTTTDVSLPINMTSNTPLGWLILEGA